MPLKRKVQDAHICDNMRALHGAMARIVAVMNRPQVDEKMVQEADIPLDSALFPLVMAVDRLAPVGLVELADSIGRDYTTVSRQVAKLESLGVVQRQEGATDRRVREVRMTARGNTMTAAVEKAREKIGQVIFADWEHEDFDQLVRLLQKFAGALDSFAAESIDGAEEVVGAEAPVRLSAQRTAKVKA